MERRRQVPKRISDMARDAREELMESEHLGKYSTPESMGQWCLSNDYWSGPGGQSISDYVLQQGGGKVLLWDAREHSAKKKNGPYLAADVCSVIDEVGSKNIFQLVTDRAPQNEHALPFIQERKPDLYVTYCAAHLLDNAGAS